MQNYRNKTIFDWNTYEENKISSFISLVIMKFLKRKFSNLKIHNVIVRDVNSLVSIILQLDDTYIDKSQKNSLYFLINEFILRKNYILKYFAIQSLYNNKFEKGKNISTFINEYIKFEVSYFNPVLISLLPNSFYQPNINILDQYYYKFNKWIKSSECNNMINLGDDGGNICIILNQFFNNMISFFHCKNSYNCAKEMIKDNIILNLDITFDINDCMIFDCSFTDIILFINPGRKGLKDYEINFINNSKNIKYIIYLACNFKAFLKDKDELEYYQINDNIEIDVMPFTKMTQNLIYMEKVTKI